MFVGGTLLFTILTIIFIVLVNKKKDAKGGLKFFAILFMLVSCFGFISTTLVYHNVVPFSLRHGYFVSVTDSSGFKVTMEKKVRYVSNGLDPYALNFESYERDAPRGYVIFKFDEIIFTFPNSNVEDQVFVAHNMGRELYSHHRLAYRFVRDIEMR